MNTVDQLTLSLSIPKQIPTSKFDEEPNSDAEDKLIGELSLETPTSTFYITGRKNVTYHPNVSNIYSSSERTRLIELLVQMMDHLALQNAVPCIM